MHQNDIKLNLIQENLKGEFSEIIFYECNFCKKTVGFYPSHRKLNEKLSGFGNFYCNSCLQNNFNVNNKHILILSFRGIIGFYHNIIYLSYKKIYFSQILDYIDSHVETGLSSPIFRYDPETFLWFVDFAKVGRGRKKIPVSEVLKATINILCCFNLPTVIDNFKTKKLYQKYEEAILKFHSQRHRPETRKILSPSLNFCGGICDSRQVDHEAFRNFTNEDLFIKE